MGSRSNFHGMWEGALRFHSTTRTLWYVDQAVLPARWKGLVRHAVPAAAILLPVAFFLSVLSPTATEPNAVIYLAFVGAVALAAGLITLGVGLVRRPRP